MKKLISMLPVCCLMGFGALAQDSDVATAFASIEKAEIGLGITTRPLSFGEIAIPASQDGLCRYSITSDGKVNMQEFDSPGRPAGSETNAGGGSTLRGCAGGGFPQAGLFQINCDPLSRVSYELLKESAQSPNVTFDVNSFVHEASDQDTSTGALDSSKGSFSCSKGQFSVAVGAVVDVYPQANPEAQASLGSISLIVNYE